MNLKKIYVALLGLLGVQMQSCEVVGEDEYGCPYIEYEYEASGTVKDEEGKAVEKAHVTFDVGPDQNGDYNIKLLETSTNEEGVYRASVRKGYTPSGWRIITEKEGFKPDTSYGYPNEESYVGSRMVIKNDVVLKKDK